MCSQAHLWCLSCLAALRKQKEMWTGTRTLLAHAADDCLVLAALPLGSCCSLLIGNTTTFKVMGKDLGTHSIYRTQALLPAPWQMAPHQPRFASGEQLHNTSASELPFSLGVRHSGGHIPWSFVLQWAELPYELTCRHCVFLKTAGEKGISAGMCPSVKLA